MALGGLGGLGGLGSLGGGLGGGLGGMGMSLGLGMPSLGATASAPMSLGGLALPPPVSTSLGALGGGLGGLGGGLGSLGMTSGLGLGGLPGLQTSVPLQMSTGMLGGISTGLMTTSAPMTSLGMGGVGLYGLGAGLGAGLMQQPNAAAAAAAAAGGRDKQTDLIMRADALVRNVSMRGMDGGPMQALMDKLRPYYKANPTEYAFKAVTYAIREPGATYAQPPLLTAEEWAAEQRLHAYDEACTPRQALVPLVLDGFADLSERLNWQARSIEQLNKATESLLSLVKTAEGSTKKYYDRLEKVRVHHMQLTERMLRVAAKVDAVVARQAPFTKEEAALARHLEEILQYLKQSANLRTRIDTLLLRQRMREEAASLNGTDASLDDESMRRVAKQLANHKRGIEQLLTILRKDARDLQIMETHRIAADAAAAAGSDDMTF